MDTVLWFKPRVWATWAWVTRVGVAVGGMRRWIQTERKKLRIFYAEFYHRNLLSQAK
jgi:hypothetical protein